MKYTLDNCTICGSNSFEVIEEKEIDSDTFVVYKCKACDSTCQYTLPKVKSKVYSATEIFSSSIDSIVSITCSLSNGNLVTGTGFVINKNGYILTNAHIVIDQAEDSDDFEVNEPISITTSSHEKYPAELIYLELKDDLALLKVDCSDFKHLKIADYNNVKTGENIYTIGNSKGEGLSITEGIVSDRLRTAGNSEKMLISTPINHGNSGGPILNEKGEVIGIVMGGRKDAVSMGYAVPSYLISNFIEKVENNEDIKILNY